ncbi:MAG: SDR family oxidoreductase [Calditrichaeota bacterium]|nr:SDR family oxidoreductase [Calditrichota bacterium]
MIITGGSRGIGAATARMAAGRGFAVCVNYRKNAAAAAAVVGDIEKSGGRALAVGADVAVETEVLALFQTVDRELGPVKVLINNAGILERQMPVAEMDAGRLHRVMATNVVGPFLCAREAVRRMSTGNGGAGGVIVNVSSMAARLGSPHEYVDYAASKGALDTMTVGLAKEVAALGIRVNGVRPGITDTEIHASGGEPDRIQRLQKRIPLQRAANPAEIAEAILWLASPAASYTTGAILDVGGGL